MLNELLMTSSEYFGYLIVITKLMIVIYFYKDALPHNYLYPLHRELDKGTYNNIKKLVENAIVPK